MSDSRKHNPNNQFGRIEHIATQNHTSRDRLEKQIRNALQTNPMRPILKKKRNSPYDFSAHAIASISRYFTVSIIAE